MLGRVVRAGNAVFVDHIANNHRALFDRLAKPYVAGYSLEEGIAAMEADFRKHGFLSTFDVLGESSTEVGEAINSREHYRSAMLALSDMNERLGAEVSTISFKPSAVVAVDEETGLIIHPDTPLIPEVLNLARVAKGLGLKITQDRESRFWTRRSIEAEREVYKKGFENFGGVYQAGMFRTEEDIIALADFANSSECNVNPLDIRVRICRGIYIEPRHVAHRRKKAKNLIPFYTRQLAEAGIYVEVATHDPRIIKRVFDEVIDPMKLGKDQIEFQFLRGVPNAYKFAPELMERGFNVRLYQPAEMVPGAGAEYMVRRLKANPRIVFYGARNQMQRMFLRN